MSDSLTNELLGRIATTNDRIADSNDKLLTAFDAIRADLKRRSERDLNATGQKPAGARGATGGNGGTTLPNYGRRKGEAIAGCPVADLEYYANGCRRTLDDPGKSRWHNRERDVLAAIEAEIARQGGSAGATAGGAGDDEIPFRAVDGRVP